jgi:TolB protein
MEEIFAAGNPEAGSGVQGEFSWESTISPLPGDFLEVAIQVTGPRGCDFTLKSQRRLAHRELLYSDADHHLVTSSEDYREHQSIPGGSIGSFSLASDGVTLAYIDKDEDGKPQIFTRKLSDQSGKLLFKYPSGAAEPAWSPDGKRIAFTAQDNGFSQLFVYQMKEQTYQNRSNSSHHDGSPAWTPDGKGLLFCRDGSSIILLRDDGETTLVEGDGWNTAPSLSADGKELVFMSNRDGNPEIYRESLANKKVDRLTNCPAYDTNPRFSADNKRILFQSDRGDDHLPRIYSMNLDGSQVESLTPKDAVSQGIWLP